jgi:sulfite reductase (NADPH) flavoprotein alpha-component
MLAGHKQKILAELVAGSGKEELIWINGYIAALIDGKNNVNETPAAVQAVPTVAGGSKKITLVYGTETGNSKRVATELAVKAKKNNLLVKLASLDQYRLTDLTREENLFVVISTQGDGEPPVAAQKFYDHIYRNGFRLDQVKYSVLALGDTSYPMFCKTGEDVDAQLEKLGGKRIVPIGKCDLDYEPDAEAWFTEVLGVLQNLQTTAPIGIKVQAQTEGKSNKKIYSGTVLSHVNLHDTGSEKETYHIELLAEEVDYLPGDSVGIVPHNAPALVNEIINITGVDGEKPVSFKEVSYSVSDLLRIKLSVVYLHERVVKKYAAIVQQEIPEIKMDLLTLLTLYPVKNPDQFEEVLQSLPAQSPRIYTIASSPSAHNGEIHLTVEKDLFRVNEETKAGLCSDYLSQLKLDDQFDFFVQKNKRFRLPAADKNVLMIGPGTGIAAFRSFISERDATGAKGKNWLFFGEDHFVSDFLYQTEIQDWHQTGVLNKVSLAFSKDHTEEFFVHDKMREQGGEIFDWIRSGAYVYVCGQKAPMSVNVEAELLLILEKYGEWTPANAKKYFEQMKEEGRYSKDVY